MAKYTTELRTICESFSDLLLNGERGDVESIIEDARPNIFSFSYPIFDEAYRNGLERKILLHYYTREIALETYGWWKLKLKTKMGEIMPYYNQLYKSTLLEFNPLYDVNFSNNRTVTNEGTKKTVGTTIQGTVRVDTGTVGNVDTLTNTGTVTNGGTVKDTGTIGEHNLTTNNLTDKLTVDGTNIRTVNADNKDAYSDTPQGGLTDVENNTYLTNYRKIATTNNENEEVDRIDTTLRTGTVDNDNTRTNDLTSTRDLTTTNNLTNERNSTLTNNLTTDIDDTKDIDNLDTINNTETYVETVMGKRGGGSYSEMLLKFRETFLNIDNQVIDELGELFFNLY